MDYESILQQLELTLFSQCRKFLKLTTMYSILYYIFPPVTLFEIIFPIPVDMALLIILDHFLVLFVFIICPIRYLFVE